MPADSRNRFRDAQRRRYRRRLPIAKVTGRVVPVDRNCRIPGEAGNRCKRATAFASAGISKSIRNTRPDAPTLSVMASVMFIQAPQVIAISARLFAVGHRGWKFSLIERASC